MLRETLLGTLSVLGCLAACPALASEEGVITHFNGFET